MAKSIAMIALWAGALWGALSIRLLPGDWGHGLCGPWGCGPPVQALVAVHAAWLVALVAPAIALARGGQISPCRRGMVGAVMIGLGLAAVGVVAWEQATGWLEGAGPERAKYLAQRIGFVVLTTTDLPMLELVAAGGALYPWRPHGDCSSGACRVGVAGPSSVGAGCAGSTAEGDSPAP